MDVKLHCCGIVLFNISGNFIFEEVKLADRKNIDQSIFHIQPYFNIETILWHELLYVRV